MNIKFKAFTKEAGKSGHSPSPATSSIPKWYKEIPKFLNNEKKWKFDSVSSGNATVKWCAPFLDAMTAGYFIYLENDIEVQKQNGDTQILWKRGGETFIGKHDYGQISPSQIPSDYLKEAYKFSNEWSVAAPTGYSFLFTHPMNRTDLPFITLSAIVDSDTYLNQINFPFILKKDFEGIIEAGTPIAQIIPIKRESWKMALEEYEEEFSHKTLAFFGSKIYRTYKKLFWTKKEYR